MAYNYHDWAGAFSCYSELLDKLQKQICRSFGPSLATSLEPLAYHQNVASLSFLYRYYFGLTTGSTGSTSLFLREAYSLL